ncbi:uncharacterized protein LOC116604508 isoform X2 [Nematostella vectensis]|uniref:uncharacterized protein LOC116604508 isoform X2 n=1 Tax=Nematostella vectensis TaxID=45351 RepID=UPI00138FDDF4|nr:uncharacterized protein LOC116604508 isoform X2 [Nematostella vectensis]
MTEHYCLRSDSAICRLLACRPRHVAPWFNTYATELAVVFALLMLFGLSYTIFAIKREKHIVKNSVTEENSEEETNEKEEPKGSEDQEIDSTFPGKDSVEQTQDKSEGKGSQEEVIVHREFVDDTVDYDNVSIQSSSSLQKPSRKSSIFKKLFNKKSSKSKSSSHSLGSVKTQDSDVHSTKSSTSKGTKSRQSASTSMSSRRSSAAEHSAELNLMLNNLHVEEDNTFTLRLESTSSNLETSQPADNQEQ